MKTIFATEGETIYDIAVREYGCYEGVFLLCSDNGFGIVTELTAGEAILIRDVVPELTDDNVQVAAYFNANNIKPNAGHYILLDGFYNDDFYSFGFYST